LAGRRGVTETVLALNAGSSTFKYTAYRLGDGREVELVAKTLEASDLPGSLDVALERLAAITSSPPSLVGHRIVHGGPRFIAPVAVDDAVLSQLEDLVELAPLHLPPALRLLRKARERLPRALHVACFDTAFHRTLPEVARRLALPVELYDAGVRRYGFHGLSYEYVLSTFGPTPPARVVIAHLGSGASLVAIRDGQSIDTSMGFTPTGGIPMGTRPGDLDPGVLIHLLRKHGYSVDALEHLVNHASGLQGLAGTSDMASLVARVDAHDASALAAIELFAYSIKKQLGAYIAALGGLDCLVFTGGIGEHVPLVRELVCSHLETLGIALEPALNAENQPIISNGSSACEVRVVPTNEDLVIARAALAVATRATA
jgi:acetate kinase